LGHWFDDSHLAAGFVFGYRYCRPENQPRLAGATGFKTGTVVANNVLHTDVLAEVFSAWMLRKLERNPIGWLEQRTWTGRLVTWGWFAVIMSSTARC